MAPLTEYQRATLEAIQRNVDALGTFVNALPGEAGEMYAALPLEARMQVLAEVAELLAYAIPREAERVMEGK